MRKQVAHNDKNWESVWEYVVMLIPTEIQILGNGEEVQLLMEPIQYFGFSWLLPFVPHEGNIRHYSFFKDPLVPLQ